MTLDIYKEIISNISENDENTILSTILLFVSDETFDRIITDLEDVDLNTLDECDDVEMVIGFLRKMKG